MGFSELLAGVDKSVRQVLGGPVTYAPSSGSPVTVRGVFDLAYIQVQGIGHAGVQSTGPGVFLRLEDLPSDPSTDVEATVTVGGVQYRIHEARPDGLGGVHLLMHAV